MKISKELTKMALRSDAKKDCTTYQRLVSAKSPEEVVKIYLDEINFCLANDFPSNDYILKHFGDIVRLFNIFIDDEIMILNPKHLIALGKTSGTIKIEEYNVCNVYVKHTSKLKIKSEGHSYVMIDVFDNAVVEVEASQESQICINRYGLSKVISNEQDNGRRIR
jgi:hypothetical protein